MIEKLHNDKIDKVIIYEQLEIIRKSVDVPNKEIKNLESKIDEQLEKNKKNIDRLSHSIDSKVTEESIQNVKDQIKLLADKETFENFEKSI